MRRTLFISNFKRVISVIAVVAITLFMISRISFILEGKTTYENYAAFMSDSEDYDVWLLGSSHVRYGFFPMELWNDYGITSYNISSDSNTLAVSYWVFKQALKQSKPKVLVLDIYDCSPNDIVYSWEFTHDATGIFPISLDKIKMVSDLSRNPEWTNHYGELTGTRPELVFKLAAFHDRWQKITSTDFWTYEDFVNKSKARKGIKINPLIVPSKKEKNKIGNSARYDSIAKEYLERIIDLCNKNEVKLVLINTGFNGNEEMELFADSIPDIAKENNIDYIDYTDLDLIDYTCDFHTIGENTHVNVSGAIKLTRYLGQYLLSHNMIKDHRDDPGYEKWNEDYQDYKDFMIQEMKATEYFEEYIEMLYGTQYDVIITVKDNSILEERNTKASLGNVGIDTGLIKSGTVVSMKNNGVTPLVGIGVQYNDDIDYSDNGFTDFDGRARVEVFYSRELLDERVFE